MSGDKDFTQELIEQLPKMTRRHLENIAEWCLRYSQTSMSIAPSSYSPAEKGCWAKGWDTFGTTIVNLINDIGRLNAALPERETPVCFLNTNLKTMVCDVHGLNVLQCPANPALDLDLDDLEPLPPSGFPDTDFFADKEDDDKE